MIVTILSCLDSHAAWGRRLTDTAAETNAVAGGAGTRVSPARPHCYVPVRPHNSVIESRAQLTGASRFFVGIYGLPSPQKGASHLWRKRMGIVQDCKWWQIEPKGRRGKPDDGTLHQRSLQPFLLRVSGNQGL